MRDTNYRLRRDVFDSLVRARGLTSEVQQVQTFGVSRATLYRILRGQTPSLASAMRMATELNVPLDTLFERVEG